MFKDTHQPRAIRCLSSGCTGNMRDLRPDRVASEAFDSGRNAQYGESREYGFPTLLDPDLDELRSEVALLVPATEQHELLIPARPQWLHRRLLLVVTPHHREVQKLPNRPPEFPLLLHRCTQARHKPPSYELAFRVAGEHPEAHRRRHLANLSHQFQQRLRLLHWFSARESNPFQRLQAACFLESLSHFEHRYFHAPELVRRRIPASSALQ